VSEAHEVGPLAEEAAKLLGALSGWAREHAPEASDGLSGLAARAASAVHGVDEHLATGAAECTVCPLCRTVHAVRQVSPEVTTHLASALSSLAQAAAALMSTPAPQRTSGDGVEHIPVDDAWPEPGSP
jgi:predicted PhzF superfamily epimerase YddE/YHI9